VSDTYKARLRLNQNCEILEREKRQSEKSQYYEEKMFVLAQEQLIESRQTEFFLYCSEHVGTNFKRIFLETMFLKLLYKTPILIIRLEIWDACLN